MNNDNNNEVEKKKEPLSIKEERIRRITKIYYSNPKIQQILLEFSSGREVVPRYFEGFGKRPDTLQYPSDVMGLVNRGATSFHASEEIWTDPLKIDSNMDRKEFDELRAGWDLLIDIDSPFLDFSKIAAILLIKELENYGINNYGIKYSGSKGFHIIVSGKAFPNEFNGELKKNMFPEWPRAICEFLMNQIKNDFSRQTHDISNINSLKLRTNKNKEQLVETTCPNCGKPVRQDKWLTLKCNHCSNETKQKKSLIDRKRILRCVNCPSLMEIIGEEEFFECAECKTSNISKVDIDSTRNIKYTREAKNKEVSDMNVGLQESYTGGFDLVLVAPRHLFRMPYSLHEKTALASIVLTKEEIEKFNPGDANPLNTKIRNFMPNNFEGEGARLLSASLIWKQRKDNENENIQKIEMAGKKFEFEEVDMKGVTEEMFPKPIKKLLKGKLNDGKKRGLFVLITFLRSAGFNPEYINNKIREWNKLNEQPLKEGYIKSQIDWHLKQKRKILPPNYDNEGFYKDLGLLDEKPKAKNPIVEVVRRLRGQ
ncbi:MAG: hypothetical protein Q8L29_00465 [archaeon]|nr:hypothetical protein [archaeon]